MPVLPDPAVTSLDDYLERGGGRAVAQAERLGPDGVLELVAASGLRGRGGAGFPTAAKWDGVRRAEGTRRYAVANGAEGEPGTYKDRAILQADPYQVLEGLAVAALVVGAAEAFVALKRSFTRELDRIRRAGAELEAAGLLGGVGIQVALGPEEYLFGEEKALLEVIEGNDPLPRVLPPYLHGLYATVPQLGWMAHEGESGVGGEANPTLVNNVETLAHVAWIVADGPEEFRAAGTDASPGTTVVTVTGAVRRPGVYEVPLGILLREVVDDLGGGPPPGRSLKLVLSGVASGVLTAEHLDVPLTYEDLAAVGSGLGSAGFVVHDDRTCALAVAHMCSRFLSVESCGQCPPCKLGATMVTDALADLLAGSAEGNDLARIARALATVTDGARCALAAEEQAVVSSLLDRFPADVQAHLDGGCPLDHEVPIPKIVAFERDGTVRLDERQARKRPDWTYDPA